MIKLTDGDGKDLLRDPAAAAAYLNAIIKDGTSQEFLEALVELDRARRVTDLATAANITQEDVDQFPKEGASPNIFTILSVLKAMGLQWQVSPKDAATGKA